MAWIGRRLAQRGVLGVNRRNLDFIQRHNPRRLYPLVDDKIRTKQIAIDAGIPVPPLYATISSEFDARRLPECLEKNPQCAIKPAHGAGGDGILVLTDQWEDRYRRSNGQWLRYGDISFHVSSILSGVYSLGGVRDRAMIEYRVQFSDLFARISYEGVPDIRVIVFLGYPVMAMVRLPTRQSDGKANLHQGAIGAGVDIATGETLDGVWFNERIQLHPDTGQLVSGVCIPGWDDILKLAARCYDVTGLGYLGVDVVLDRDRGPLLLELNARPGLNIQIANDIGLEHRCAAVEEQPEGRSVADRVAFARDRFAAPRPATLDTAANA